MTNKQAASIITFIVAGLIVAGLTVAGIFLIVQSNNAYDKSLEYIELALKDTSLKSKLAFTPGFSNIKDGYTESLVYFSLAAGVLLLVALLPRLQNISFGGFTITLKDIQEQVNQLAIQSNDLEGRLTGRGGGKTSDATKVQEAEALTKEVRNQANTEPAHPNDPQKGEWGGKPEANGRRLSATVTPTLLPDLFKVILKVSGTSSNPLSGLVKFHLHNTFKNQDPVIAVINGKAKLVLNQVWGAFTVGAEADGGDTHLELDLAGKDVKAPKEFKER